MTYAEYRQLVNELVSENKTTGPRQTVELISFTKLNEHRMARIDKTTKLLPELEQVLVSNKRALYWVVLVEAWCGDGAQNLPVIARMAETASNIELRILFRDENLSIMDAHLMNGSRSIPMLVCLDKVTLREIGEWGPRPARLQKVVDDFKQKHDVGSDKSELEKTIHLWYAGDRSLSIQHEFMQLLPQWAISVRGMNNR